MTLRDKILKALLWGAFLLFLVKLPWSNKEILLGEAAGLF